MHLNETITALKSAEWLEISSLLGRDVEVIFISLLLDCGIFTKLNRGKGNYFHFSGVPLSELPQVQSIQSEKGGQDNRTAEQATGTGHIRFVRQRMLYARASLNATGKVRFGLHHSHFFQRLDDASDQRHAVHLSKYVFPRQFGFHNVFTSKVDQAETVQKLKDYTFREQEITGRKGKAQGWAPRRVRGDPIRLLQKIHRNHKVCCYDQFLRHYCPLVSAKAQPGPVSPEQWTPSMSGLGLLATQTSVARTPRADLATSSPGYDWDTSFLAHASPVSCVSAFCRAVVTHLLPRNTFGCGSQGQQNHDKIMKRIDDMILLRRFESMTLHQVMQGIRLSSITWLAKPGSVASRMCGSDYSKRLELLHEFIYYLFDSFLVPLIRAHFYVTESSTHRHQLFYFRQDVWRKLSEPSLATLRLNMYAPVKPSEARRRLVSRSLGYSHVRLLPKDQGSRPITNLKRKQLRLGSGRRILGPSINTQLSPLFSILNFERGLDSQPLGSALFSVGDIHGKVAEFRERIQPGSRLFFAKVDIKSCFDSIPQGHLLALVESLFTEQSYRTTKHMEVKAASHSQLLNGEGLRRSFIGLAQPNRDEIVLSEPPITAMAGKKRHVVFSDLGQQRVWSRVVLLKLLRDHIGDSMVKIGKRYMKQIDGIPQGSVLSSLLCSYFYGAFERNELGFLRPESCLLLRLIDDFLLVTVDEGLARRFLTVMENGDRRYGIQVNPEKSLVNFDVTLGGHKVPRLHGKTAFPYCGMGLELRTLELSKDRGNQRQPISNSLTIEIGSRPGKVLKRKTLASLKLQMRSMLLDMKLNGRNQVISTLVGNFTLSAMKMHRYVAGLAVARRPSQGLIRGMIEDLITVGWKICRAKCSDRCQTTQLSHTQMCWIAAVAFERVLGRKQSQYRELLVWLRVLRASSRPRMNMAPAALDQVLGEGDKLCRESVY